MISNHPTIITPPFSLFELIHQQLDPNLLVTRCTKATLLDLSHTLEDLVLSRNIPALFFAGLQEYGQWRQEWERYQKLTQVTQHVCVFTSLPLSFQDEINFSQVILDSADPLCQEWFLVILSKPLALVLCGQDSQVEATNDATRQFDLVWSFEPNLVNQVLDFLEEIIKVYQPEQLASLQTIRANYTTVDLDLTLVSDLMGRMVHFEETSHQRFREAEGILQRYQARLEAQVAQRTADLVATNEQLEQEIIERREAEVALAEERNLLRILIDNLPDYIYVKDTQNRFLLANIAALQTLQLTRMDELVGKTDSDLHPPELAAQYYADEQAILQSGEPVIGREECRVTPTGEQKWYLITKVPLRDSYGQIIGLVGLNQDITARKQSEEELQRYRNHLEELVIERTAELKIANKQLQQEIYERQRAEAEREHLLAAEHEQRLLAETMQEVTLTLISKIDLDAILHEILRQAQRLVPHKTASIALLEGDILRVAYRQGYDVLDHEISGSDLGQLLADLPLEKAAIDTHTALIVPDTHQESGWVVYTETSWIRSHLAVPICLHDHVLGLLRLDSDTPGQFSIKDAQHLQALVNAAAIALENARLHAETQKLYQQTQQQARQLEQILNAVQSGIVLLDHDYRIRVVNSMAQMCLPILVGVEVGEICTHLGGRPLSEFLSALPPVGYHEVTPEGQSRPIFEVKTSSVVTEAGTEGWVLVMRDVTDQRDIQKRVQEQEKLAAVGQLAAGIAHDFNNILTSIIGFAELARYEPNVPVSVQVDLGHVVQQGKRAAHLVRQILDFARKNITTKQPLEFSSFLKEIVRLLKRTLPETIRLDLNIELPQEPYILSADVTQLQQVLTNLAVNAADAMPMGGILKFYLSRLTQQSDCSSSYPPLPPGDWLVLAVTDTGTGISLQVLPHIFEPFFTTKEVGQGTGLGLAQVDGIIKQHDGFISVESELGKGTTFTLYLPLLYLKQLASPEIHSQKKFSGRGETLLLVEDDSSVLEVTQAMLKGLGYQVLTATNGLAALEIYEQHQKEIALVITDLTMPNMGGLALAEALQAQNHEVKILAMTGYPLKIGTGALRANGIAGWLQKPLSLEQLAHKLEQILTS